MRYWIMFDWETVCGTGLCLIGGQYAALDCVWVGDSMRHWIVFGWETVCGTGLCLIGRQYATLDCV